MSGWTPHFDITTIPDDVLLRESARRLRARQLHSPRAKVLRQCPKCGEPFGARELRKHLPRCVEPAAHGMRLNPSRVVRKVSSVEEQEAENYRYWQSIPVGARRVAVCELSEAGYAIRELGQNANQGHVNAMIEGDTPTYVISRENLIKNKLAAGREQDILDVKQIQKAAAYAPEQPTQKTGKRKKKKRKGIER
jgi:hypothetical protein